MTKPLRSLSGLLDFESAARWNSFKLAARELHKTPAAISQQIKGLEQQLGFDLFVRHPRNVSLTEKGQALAATLRRNLAELNEKVESLRTGGEENLLRISVPHSLSMKWLVPNLAGFSTLHPQVDVRVDSTDSRLDLESEALDLALRITDQSAPAHAVLLGQEDLVAIYSPALEERYGKPLDLKALNAFALLYQQTPECWLQWMKNNKALAGEHDFSREFSHSGILVQAAVAGQGIGLAPYIIALEDLRQGALKLLPGKPLFSSCRYYAIPAIHAATSENTRLFCEWLQGEFREAERLRLETGKPGGV
jgi:LysR family glycine cleavage system transcriptional activator